MAYAYSYLSWQSYNEIRHCVQVKDLLMPVCHCNLNFQQGIEFVVTLFNT